MLEGICFGLSAGNKRNQKAMGMTFLVSLKTHCFFVPVKMQMNIDFTEGLYRYPEFAFLVRWPPKIPHMAIAGDFYKPRNKT